MIQAGSALDRITLKAANIEEKTRLIIIAIQDQAGAFFYNPPGEKKLQAGDALLGISDQSEVQTLHKLTGDRG